MKRVCIDVEVKPKLQPVSHDDERLDHQARGFLWPGRSAFFDIRVANTNAISQVSIPIEKIYKKHKNKKKRKYNDRVLNIEHDSFTLLVFYSITGRMSQECTSFHKHLDDNIARKTEQR